MFLLALSFTCNPIISTLAMWMFCRIILSRAQGISIVHVKKPIYTRYVMRPSEVLATGILLTAELQVSCRLGQIARAHSTMLSLPHRYCFPGSAFLGSKLNPVTCCSALSAGCACPANSSVKSVIANKNDNSDDKYLKGKARVRCMEVCKLPLPATKLEKHVSCPLPVACAASASRVSTGR